MIRIVVGHHLFELGLRLIRMGLKLGRQLIRKGRLLRRCVLKFNCRRGENQSLPPLRSEIGDPLARSMRRKKPIDNSGATSSVSP